MAMSHSATYGRYRHWGMARAVTLRLVMALMLVFAIMSIPGAAHAQSGSPGPATPGPCNVGPLPGGSLGMICVPLAGWNGDLVVFAHGYRAFNESLAFQNIEFSDGSNLPTITQALGYAFATTTYRQNGLAVLTGLDDVRELLLAFRLVVGRAPVHTYMVGASEGGLLTALLIERSPELFSGGLALCGPIGDFRAQISYLGDFRVLFDSFFPGVLPRTVVQIPDALIQSFDSQYLPKALAAVRANQFAALQLIATSKAAIDPRNGESILQTVRDLLWYSTFATNDAAAKLGGNPYGNLLRIYTGSINDLALNQSVFRTASDPVTLLNILPYQTSGRLSIPLVTMHTIGDDIIPFVHEVAYQAKARTTGRGSLTQIPIPRYGHCNFTGQEALAAFGLLVQQVTGAQPASIAQPLDRNHVKQAYDRAARETAPALPRDKP
jgi:pimeloyl-ACP methyl ester carboxylesterase